MRALGSLMGFVMLAGCVAVAPARVTDNPNPPPPAVRAEAIPPPPLSERLQIWQPGHWDWDGAGGYVWREGSWVDRAGHGTAWQDGYWSNSTGVWIWVPAHWV